MTLIDFLSNLKNLPEKNEIQLSSIAGLWKRRKMPVTVWSKLTILMIVMIQLVECGAK